MAKDFTVTVGGERGAEFETVFGSATVAVMSPLASLADLPGFQHPQPVYWLDMGALTGEQLDRLVTHIVRKFDASEADVRRHLELNGMPILAKDCVVTIEHARRWID